MFVLKTIFEFVLKNYLVKTKGASKNKCSFRKRFQPIVQELVNTQNTCRKIHPHPKFSWAVTFLSLGYVKKTHIAWCIYNTYSKLTVNSVSWRKNRACLKCIPSTLFRDQTLEIYSGRIRGKPLNRNYSKRFWYRILKFWI